MEEQLEKNIPESLKKKGIEVTACKVHIEGELLKVCLWTKEVPDGELERGIKDELAANWGIREENCEVLAWENGKQTMGDSSPFGTSACNFQVSNKRDSSQEIKSSSFFSFFWRKIQMQNEQFWRKTEDLIPDRRREKWGSL